MSRSLFILCMVTMIVSCINPSYSGLLSAALPNDSPPTFYPSAASYGHCILTSIQPLHSSYTTIAPSPPPTSTPLSPTAYISRGARLLHPPFVAQRIASTSLSLSLSPSRVLFG
jgi:hypothetical protein